MNKKYIRKKRIFKRIFGTVQKPRLSIFRSNRHFYAQLIDDINQRTIAEISTNNSNYPKLFSLNSKVTKDLGSKFAKKILDSNLSKKIVFDKNRWIYHGRIKSFADGLRENGLNF